jgi:hypothetical protein
VANPGQEHTVVSPDNRDKANRAASPDNTSRRKVAKVRMKRMKTIRCAIVSVVLRSFSTAMITDQLGSPGLAGTSFLLEPDACMLEGKLRPEHLRGSQWQRRNSL